MPSWRMTPTSGRSTHVICAKGSFASKQPSKSLPPPVSSAKSTVPHGVQSMPSSRLKEASWATTSVRPVFRSTTETAPLLPTSWVRIR